MDENAAIEKAERWARLYQGRQGSAISAFKITRDLTQEDWWRRIPLLERRVATLYLNNWIVLLHDKATDQELSDTYTVAVDDSTGVVSVIE